MTVKAAVLGAGSISSQYLDTLTRVGDIEVVAVADLDEEAARSRAQAFGIECWGGPQVIWDGPAQVVVNLTPPAAHASTTLAALAAGKLVWCEKTLATTYAEARAIEEASEGWRVACAPDTVLGLGAQRWLRELRAGAVGTVSSALALFTGPGPQAWHPAPEFLFSAGAGPLRDMGPYYLTWLVHALGPVCRVSAVASTAQASRVIGAGPRAGTRFEVSVPTTHALVLETVSGATVDAVFSFDSGVRRKHLEVTGETGTLVAPDPNKFDGEVVRFSSLDEETVRLSTPASPVARGLGVVEMARAVSRGEVPRASVAVAAHVVEVLDAVDASVAAGRAVEVTSRPQVPQPLEPGWDPLAETGCTVPVSRG